MIRGTLCQEVSRYGLCNFKSHQRTPRPSDIGQHIKTVPTDIFPRLPNVISLFTLWLYDKAVHAVDCIP